MTNTNKYLFPTGKRIAYFRTLKGFSVNKLANLAGISQSYLRDIELENKNPTVEMLSLICQALDISLQEFFSDESEVKIEDPLLIKIFQLTPAEKQAVLELLQVFKKD
ncbi:MAG: helix-turn-helix domain-containing protein [Lachnospiraceae bacterium]